MLKIAACDDDKRTPNQIQILAEKAAREVNETVEVTLYESGEEFCARADLAKLDLVYMDIRMLHMDGIRAALRYREMNLYGKLIYVSAYDTHFRDLYQVNTFGFLDKPINEDKFKELFHKACWEIWSYQDAFTYRFGKETFRVLLRDILYFCSEGHLMKIHCVDGAVHSYYEKMSEVAARMPRVGFYQISKSYMVNIVHVKRMNLANFTLKNGEILPARPPFNKAAMGIYSNKNEKEIENDGNVK